MSYYANMLLCLLYFQVSAASGFDDFKTDPFVTKDPFANEMAQADDPFHSQDPFAGSSICSFSQLLPWPVAVTGVLCIHSVID